jgi:hypothetical protein
VNTLTAQVVTDCALHPTMDAIAHGLDEARLIHDPSPQIDSLTEMLAEQVRVGLAMARLLSDLALANGLQVDCERIVAGFADDVAATLRHCEHNAADGPLSARALAGQLAQHLDALSSDPAGRGGQQALAALQAMFLEVPRSVLFGPTVLRNLGVARSELLHATHRAFEGRRAARDQRRHRESRA